MIQVTFFQNKDNVLTGFRFIGHAEYDVPGEDVVCAGVSALVINAINSIDRLTEDVFSLDTNQEQGLMHLSLNDNISHDTSVLLQALVIGVQGISEQYGTDFVKIHFKEV